MKKAIFACLSGVLLFISCNETPKKTAELLIVNASIVDVENGSTAANRLVAISGDSIIAVVGMEEFKNFEAPRIFDAEDNYLMPGLWDNHVHFRGGDSLVQENKDLLPLFLAYGITSVRDAGGDIVKSVLDWREQIARNELAGPRIFTPGPKLDGPDPAWAGSIKVENPGDVAAALDSLMALNADFVKTYDGSLSKETFYAIIKAAEERGMQVTGHMPMSADILEAVELGLDGSEHLYYVLKSASPLADSLTKLNLGYGMVEDLIRTYDPELAQKAFEQLREEQVFVTPTLHIGKTLSEILDVDHSRDSILPYIGSGIQKTYEGRIRGAERARKSGSSMRQDMERKSLEMIKPMFEAGVPLLAGSDSGPFNSFVYPGPSLHDELALFVEAGLTPQEALTTSVVRGPEFFGLADSFGSVEAGKVADLLLLKENPLDDLDNLKKIVAVIQGEQIYTREELRNMLEQLKQ